MESLVSSLSDAADRLRGTEAGQVATIVANIGPGAKVAIPKIVLEGARQDPSPPPNGVHFSLGASPRPPARRASFNWSALRRQALAIYIRSTLPFTSRWPRALAINWIFL